MYLHVEEMFSDDGILMAAASNAQAEKAAERIGNCELIRVKGNHDIHRFSPAAFVAAVNKLL